MNVSLDAAPLRRYRCKDCGYGASRRFAPVRCPMCGCVAWSEEAWRPVSDVTFDLVPAARADFDADLPLVRELRDASVFPGVPLS